MNKRSFVSAFNELSDDDKREACACVRSLGEISANDDSVKEKSKVMAMILVPLAFDNKPVFELLSRIKKADIPFVVEFCEMYVSGLDPS